MGYGIEKRYGLFSPQGMQLRRVGGVGAAEHIGSEGHMLLKAGAGYKQMAARWLVGGAECDLGIGPVVEAKREGCSIG